MGDHENSPICYLKGVDVSALSKTERRRMTRQAKKSLQQKLSSKNGNRAARSMKRKLSKEERCEKFTAYAKKKREKQLRREIKLGLKPQFSRNSNDPDTNKMYCLGCRGKGHLIKNCLRTSASVSTVVCYRCGSTEHTLKYCPDEMKSNKKGIVTTYAVCFVCKEKGHLSSSCPKNLNGIYPKGGSCKICLSVAHLAENCPEKEDDKNKPLKTSPSKIVFDDEYDAMVNSSARAYEPSSKKPKKMKEVKF